MGFPMAIVHHLGRFSSELHVQCLGDERREAPFRSALRLHHQPQGRRTRMPPQIRQASLCPHQHSNHVDDLIQGVIEGETRVLAASMTMEQIFKGIKEFKKQIFYHVQLELNQFGLLIYNANVKQLVDVPGHKYFSYLGQKIQIEAANQARVDVAEAKMKGEIGSKTREGETLQNATKIDAETKVIAMRRTEEGQKEGIKVKAEVKIFENDREAEMAEANSALATKRASWIKSAQVAWISIRVKLGSINLISHQ